MRLRCLWMGLMAFGLKATATAGPLPVVNGSFEAASSASSPLPPGWTRWGDPVPVVVDAKEHHGGAASAHLEAPGSWVALAQGVEAAPYRGKLVAVRGWFRWQGSGPGTPGAWISTNAADDRQLRIAVAGEPVAPGSGWVRRQAALKVDESAERLYFGAMNHPGGVLWADDLELVELDGPASMSPAARAYLDQAIASIRRVALNADQVDWDALKPELDALADGATTPADTYGAIQAALAALGDHHSQFVRPEVVRQVRQSTDVTDFGQASRTLARAGYVAVPGFVGNQPARSKAFAEELQQRLADLHAAGACGYVVDLRRDSGGNMFPMLAGLAPLFGDGKMGSRVGRDGTHDWASTDGIVHDDYPGNEVRPAHPRRFADGSSVPVAVLTGPGTASSGESVLVSFIGRPATRTFGQASAGLSTSNNFMPLPDGAALAVATSVLADRTGKTYGGPIAPDETVAPGPKDGRLEDDPVVAAARHWLESQPPCATRAD